MGFFSPTSRDDRQSAAPTDAGTNYLLWIDGVGTWLVYLQETLRIGGPGKPGSSSPLRSEWADLALLSNLSRHHATITRSGESYYLEAHAPVLCQERPVNDRVLLSDRATLKLNQDIILSFTQPTALSTSACLEFTSFHQPQQRLDGIVLMADNCLLGATGENHIVCKNWPGSVVIYRQGDQVLCRSRQEIYVNEEPASQGAVLTPGCLVSGPELRFRWEVIV